MMIPTMPAQRPIIPRIVARPPLTMPVYPAPAYPIVMPNMGMYQQLGMGMGMPTMMGNFDQETRSEAPDDEPGKKTAEKYGTASQPICSFR
ncbi:MAG: hypothetical protein P4M11_15385 [Candidatus Pacebacteria bacterium]|nr:hypothetical protein [Candidatus Paceibacterota bacterium]